MFEETLIKGANDSMAILGRSGITLKLLTKKIYVVNFISMKAYKIALLIIAAVFLFSSFSFCNEEDASDDGSHCCVVCCSAGCHASAVQNNQSTILYSPFASFIPINTTLRQELFVGGIEHIPKSLI